MTDSETWPDEEMLRAVFAAAEEYRAAEVWELLADDHVFRFTAWPGDQPTHALVLGNGGEVFGIALYPGDEGQRTRESMLSRKRLDADRLRREMRSITLTFEDRECLDPDELKLIRRLGLKFRGRNRWPAFRSYVPRYLPWKVTQYEADLLLVAMQLAMQLAADYGDDPDKAWNNAKGLIPVFTPAEDGTFTQTWAASEPAPPRPDYPSQPVPEDLVAQIGAGVKRRRGAWEFAAIDAGMVVAERGKRPYSALMIAVIDGSTGMVLAVEVASPTDWPMMPVNVFLTAVGAAGGVPAEVRMDDPELEAAVRPLFAALDVTARRTKLPGVGEFKRGLKRFSGGF